ncbi:hypothetical protein BT63DRAFT_285589 [Microthyrium microscopicum]|uniref:RSE1/DDB1/CPSF1 first beta-propeller domain-containing protein n=1 Tax=Microthyrium microscopicum TaxID=703497 RepID=A0A6A6UBS9_9PEZI|nr:hypothetical protein BT63DRAFT_285589 [Microthyrium microscopicum]
MDGQVPSGRLGRISIQDIINQPSRSNVSKTFPRIGLFHRTLVNSPCTRQILTARIRHRHLNDLIFVGENFITIKTVDPSDTTPRLVTVGTKNDFRSRIRAAAIIGEQYVPKQGLATKVTAPLDDVFPPNILILSLENSEILFLVADKKLENGNLQFYQSCVYGTPVRNTLFNEPGAYIAVDNRCNVIAVAALGGLVEIVLLKSWAEIAEEFQRNRKNWCAVRRSRSLSDTPLNGTILKIAFLNSGEKDENGSLLAVVQRVRDHTRLSCWQGDLFVGPQTAHPFLIEFPLESKLPTQGFKNGISCPDLMIPYECSPRFILACSSTLHIFKIEAGEVKHEFVETHPEHDEQFKPRHPETYEIFPAFTSYSHCFRAASAKRKKAEFHLLREDGFLVSVQDLKSNGRAGITLTRCAEFACKGSTAVSDFLTTGYLIDPDSVIVGGCLSDGRSMSVGGYEVPSGSNVLNRGDAMTAKTIQSFPNWAPILDLQFTQAQPANIATETSLYVTSGQQPYGCLTEMVFGVKGAVEIVIPLPGIADAGTATAMWIVKNWSKTEGKLYFISYASTTLLLYGPLDALSITDLDEETIGIAQEEDVILRVTHRSLSVYKADVICAKPEDIYHSASLSFNDASHITAASAIPGTIQVIVAITDEDQHNRLALYMVREKASDDRHADYAIELVGHELKNLGYTPTSTTVFLFNNRYFAAIGSTNASVHIVSIDHETGLASIGSHSFSTINSTQQARAIQSVGILRDEHRGTYTILCGCRGGNLYTISLRPSSDLDDSPLLDTSTSHSLSIGIHPVTVYSDLSINHQPHAAYLSCSWKTVRVTADESTYGPIKLDNLWHIKDGADQTPIKQPQYPVIGFPSDLQTPELSRIFTTCDEGIFLSSIVKSGTQALEIPRKIPLSVQLSDPAVKLEPGEQPEIEEGGSPSALLYISRLNTMLVASIRKEVVSSPPNSTNTRRLWRHALQYVPLDESSRTGDDNLSEHSFYLNTEDRTVLPLGTFERVLCMCEWSYKLDNEPFSPVTHQILVSTSVKEANGRSGKLYFLHASRHKGGRGIETTIQKVKTVRKPFKAMVAYSESKLAVLDKDELSIYSLNKDEHGAIKWNRCAAISLQDIPRTITAKAPNLYVTTATKSIMVYTYIEDTTIAGRPSGKLIKAFGDEMGRPTAAHLVLPLNNTTNFSLSHSQQPLSQQPSLASASIILLASDDSTLAIIDHPPTPASDHPILPLGATTLLKTDVPQPISKLAIATNRPPWLLDSANPPGILGPDILGTSPDGALRHMRVLSAPATHLLQFLAGLLAYTQIGYRAESSLDQGPDVNLGSREQILDAPTIDPAHQILNESLATEYADPTSTGAGLATAMTLPTRTDRAIDGDTLAWLRHVDGPAKLREMLTQLTWEVLVAGTAKYEVTMTANRVLNSREKRMGRFIALVNLVLGPPAERRHGAQRNGDASAGADEMEVDLGGEVSARELEEAIERCVKWFRMLWEVV